MEQELPDFTVSALSGYPGLSLFLIGVALTLTVSLRPKLFWPLLLIANILGNGPKIVGYVVLDEVFTAFLLLGALMRISIRPQYPQQQFRNEGSGAPFLLLIGYLGAQAVVGAFVNNDFRILRFTLLFLMLGVLWFVVYRRRLEFSFPRLDRLLYICSITVSVYWILYLVQGVISEQITGRADDDLGRFLTQDYFWAGPAAAVLPILLGAPAAILLANLSRFRAMLTAATGMFLAMSVSFFFYSRMCWFVLIGCWAVSFRGRRPSHSLFLVVAFAGAAMFWRPLAQDLPGLVDELAATSVALWSPSESDGRSRMLQLEAAADTMMLNWKTLLIGAGFYSHRYLMVPQVRDSLSRLYPNWPDFTSSVVVGGQEVEIIRTTGLPALMVDTGLLGIGLLGWNIYLLTARMLRRHTSTAALFALLALATALWLLVANILDSVLFFLLLMPHGILDQWSAAPREESISRLPARNRVSSPLAIVGTGRTA